MNHGYMKDTVPGNDVTPEAFAELEKAIYHALETYSNVHRGSGHFSMATTHLFEQARHIVLEYLGLKPGSYCVIFCTPARAASLVRLLKPDCYQETGSHVLGLALGVRALAVRKNALPKGIPAESGGGTTKLISREWVIWAGAPDKFEAGTPAIINIIAFARALLLAKQYGNDAFITGNKGISSAADILYHDELEHHSGSELLEELRKLLIGRNIQVPTTSGMAPFINFDNSASTPTFTPVWNSFSKTLRAIDSVKKDIIRETKKICAAAMGAPQDDYDVYFTSNTTEAVNLVAESLPTAPPEATAGIIVNSLLEHSSNDLPWRSVSGHTLLRLSINDEGFIDLYELESLLKTYNREFKHGSKRIRLVAVSGASNVLGSCNDLAAISRVVHEYDAHLLVDAAQMAAHRKINLKENAIDYMVFSAHKVYAPFGCGVLIVKKDLLNLSNERQQQIIASGEENASGIAALGKALHLMQRIGMDVVTGTEKTLTTHLLQNMADIPGLRIYGIKGPESAAFECKIGVIAFSLKNMWPNVLAKQLALQGGIGVRYGCHCAHILVKHILNVSPGFERFQRFMITIIPSIKFPGVTRVSLGIENNEEEIDKFIHILNHLSKQKGSSPHNNDKSSPYVKKSVLEKQLKEFVKDVALKVFD